MGSYEDFVKMVQSTVTLPVIVGIGTILACAILSTYWFTKKKKRPITLVDSTAKVPLMLAEKIDISHDTKKFRFALPSENHILGLPVGQHIFLSCTIDNEPIIRSYTPVTSDEHIGYMDLVVKVYMAGVHPKFPNGGKMSQYLNNMKTGEYIDVRGPSGRLKYLGGGRFSLKLLRKDPPRIVTVSKVAMIAGGTGITPMLQLIRHITNDPQDTTKMSLIFANQMEKDILLRDELEEVVKKHSAQFKLWYTLDTPSPGWEYSTGFINAAMIKEHLFPPAADTLVLMCGPPPMVNFACIPNLDTLGYDPMLRFAY